MTNPKILIMVLSFDQPPYSDLMQAQLETWAAVPEFEVKTLFYHGGSENSIHHKIVQQNHKSSAHILQLPCTDSYYYMSHKFSLALEYVKDWDYDIIFRTNSSSYVNKNRLLEFAETLPKEKLYAGWTFVDSEDFGGLCVSGAGIFLSRDTAEILREQINPEVEREEDVEIGRILRRNGITAIDDKSRYDVPSQFYEIPLDRFHYRFKTRDRTQDANSMRLIHDKIQTVQ